MTINDIKKLGAKEHHTSWMRGYVTRKDPEGTIEPYEGRFGSGFKRIHPSWSSTTYCYVTYYIFD